jgi:hypothetical protein
MNQSELTAAQRYRILLTHLAATLSKAQADITGLQTEVQDLQDRLKKPEAESKFQAPFVPAAEIAATFNCTPQTIRNYAREFGLGVRVANRWVFPREAIVDIQVLMEKRGSIIKVSP